MSENSLSNSVQSTATAAYESVSTTGERTASGLCETGLGVANIGPLDALTAYGDGREALQDAKESGLPGVIDGEQDAFRHCDVSCKMTQSIGAHQAEEAGDIHETCAIGADLVSTAMDLYNNSVGRSLAGEADCKVACKEALEDGSLLTKDEIQGLAEPHPEANSPVETEIQDWVWDDLEAEPEIAWDDLAPEISESAWDELDLGANAWDDLAAENPESTWDNLNPSTPDFDGQGSGLEAAASFEATEMNEIDEVIGMFMP